MLPPVAPVVVVEQDMGGLVSDFAARITDYRRHHVQVVVRGECDSACTMVLGLKRVCAEPSASFGFHQAFNLYANRAADPRNRNEAGTRFLLRRYPLAVRAWIAAHGGLTERLITLSGAEMAAVVPVCR